ncbi:bile acid:sodium symporter [Ensifer sp. 2YAB10]|uniref:bile acid:sodium symporter n=1 Tax=unclassified Ensifer TaxID=2633371 RepID=UPI003F930C7A
MAQILQPLLSLTLVLFMLGSLFEVALKLRLEDAWLSLRDGRFVMLSLLFSFIVGPAAAIFIVNMVPMPEPYAAGLLLLGLTPCAPFLPLVTEKANAAAAYAAAFILLSATGTLLVMPLVVPWLIAGLHADTQVIARPLLYLVLLPFALGVTIRRISEPFAEQCHPVVRKFTLFNIAIMLATAFLLNWEDMLSAFGTFAVAAQILYYPILGFGSYLCCASLPDEKRSVIVLGVCTRNVGAALAPLTTIADADSRSLTMCIMAAFITVPMGFAAANILARLSHARKRNMGTIE